MTEAVITASSDILDSNKARLAHEQRGAAYLGDFSDELGLLRLHDLHTQRHTQTRLLANTRVLMCTNCAA